MLSYEYENMKIWKSGLGKKLPKIECIKVDENFFKWMRCARRFSNSGPDAFPRSISDAQAAALYGGDTLHLREELVTESLPSQVCSDFSNLFAVKCVRNT